MKKSLLSSIFTICTLFAFGQTIAEIQGTGDESPYIDQVVTTTGIVTAISPQGYYIQDGTGIRSGIYVYDPGQVLALGDEVDITATVDEFYMLTELKDITSLEVLSAGNPLPEPIELSTAEIVNEDYEGVLVKVVGAICTNTDLGFGEWELNDGSGACRVDDLMYLFTPMLNTSYSVTGLVHYSFDNYKIEPRNAEDISIDLPLYMTKLPKENNITQSDLTIQWETNVAATSKLAYGFTPALELGTIELELLTTTHEIELTNLSPATIYYVEASSILGDDVTPTSLQVMCTASNSSGAIKTYFNHSVDHSVATDELAITTDHIIDTIVYYIDQSQMTLDITIYEAENQEIIDAINAAYDRGVQIRLISDDMGVNDIFSGLNSNIPILEGNTEGIMHDKFILIDREDVDNAWVMTGSMNHTEANLGWDFNNVICIQDQSLARSFTLEFNEMWGGNQAMPNESNAKFGNQKSNNTPHCFNINNIPVELYFSPTDGTAAEIAKVINEAEYEVAFALLIFTENSLGNAIRDAHVAGLDVKGIIDEVDSGGSEFNFLTGQGVNVFDYQNADGTTWPDGPQFHHKYGIFDYETGDNPIVITGSHNWTASANSIHDENTLIIKDATLANVFFQEFNQRFNSLLTDVQTPTVQQLKVYPNPVNALLMIDVSEDGKLYVSDLSGKIVLEKTLFKGQATIDLNEFPVGMYFLKMNDFVGKIVKTQK